MRAITPELSRPPYRRENALAVLNALAAVAGVVLTGCDDAIARDFFLRALDSNLEDVQQRQARGTSRWTRVSTMADEMAPLITIVGRAEDSEAVLATIERLAASIPKDQPDRVVLDALLSLYLRAAFLLLGADGARRALDRARRNIPRAMAAIRADQAQRERPDAKGH